MVIGLSCLPPPKYCNIMITFPCAKINLGLNVVAKRPDGSPRCPTDAQLETRQRSWQDMPHQGRHPYSLRFVSEEIIKYQ